MKILRIVKRGMDRTLELCSVLCVITLIGVVIIQVFSRFFLPRTPQWTEELTRFLFIGTVAFAAGIAVRDKGFVNVDTLVELLPAKTKFIIGILMKLVTITLMLIIIQYAIPFIRLGQRQLSSSLLIPMSIPFSMTFISPFFVAVYTGIDVITEIAAAVRVQRSIGRTIGPNVQQENRS